MRKAMGVAAAAGMMLLIAGCGSGSDGADKGGPSSAGSASAGSSASGGPAGSGGGRPDGAAVTKELTDAATGAGLTRDASGEQVPAELKDCMVSWTADAGKATDPAKSYKDAVATLTEGGWTEERGVEQGGSVIKSLRKSTWKLNASDHSSGPLKMVMFVAVDSGPECAAAIAENNAKSKKS